MAYGIAPHDFEDSKFVLLDGAIPKHLFAPIKPVFVIPLCG